MMEQLSSPDHVFALGISGTLTSEDFDKVIEAVEAVSRATSASALVYIRDIEDATLEARTPGTT